MKWIFTLPVLFLLTNSFAQPDSKLSFGLEQDILPYFTSGYYGSIWVGKDQVRMRALTAHVHKPSFITPDDFTNNQVTAYAILADYFLKTNWSGWWVGTGVVYWDSSIQHTSAGNTVSYDNVLLNGSLGYQWKFYKQFYVSPWAGLHVRVAGDKQVSVDGATFTTPLFNPEASLKIGWYFN